MIRITGGSFRGRKLKTPSGMNTRPTASRVLLCSSRLYGMATISAAATARRAGEAPGGQGPSGGPKASGGTAETGGEERAGGARDGG